MNKRPAPVVRINVKYYLMSIAEVLDAFRTIPRLLVAGYSYLVWYSVNWFMIQPDPSTAASLLISTIIGGAAGVFAFYVNSGAAWSRKTADKQDWVEPTDPRHFPRYPRRPRRHSHASIDTHTSHQHTDEFGAPVRKRGRPTVAVEQDQRELPPDDWFV